MGPKVKKDLESAWRTDIEEAPLSDQACRIRVVMIECAGREDCIYLNKYQDFATKEKRCSIKDICYSETMFMVNQLGADKKVKDESLRVFEEGQAFLKLKQNIPPDILSLIIKKLIIKKKEEFIFITRQQLEVAEGLRRESLTMLDKQVVKDEEKEKPPEIAPTMTPKAKKNEANIVRPPEIVEGKKYNTVLRERGEEWRDRIYVDDGPTDGPDLYISLSGFMNPRLCVELLKIGVPITAFVQINIEEQRRESIHLYKSNSVWIDGSFSFWEEVQFLRIARDSGELLKNTAFIVFHPPYWKDQELSFSPEKAYDEISYLLYDIQDLSRQHNHYLENMEIEHIPEYFENERPLNCYHQRIDDIPLECITIYSVLDSIVSTVSAQNMDNTSATTTSSEVVLKNVPTNKKKFNETISQQSKLFDAKVNKVTDLISDIFAALCNADANSKKYRLTYGEAYEKQAEYFVLPYGDLVRLPTFHLKNMNLANIVRSMLLGMPLYKLWLRQDLPTFEMKTRIDFHVNVLLSCFNRQDICEMAELSRLLHILACRKLYNNRSSLKKFHLKSRTIKEFQKIYLKRNVISEPFKKEPSLHTTYRTRSPSLQKSEDSMNGWEELTPSFESPQSLPEFACPDISELISATEIQTNLPTTHIIDDFEYFEDFSGNCAYQVLHDAFNSFNCVDYKYCEVTDCFIMMFFDNYNPENIIREEWRSSLPTPVCLQDFFDFVLDEEYDWVKNEEDKYDNLMHTRKISVSQVTSDALGSVTCIDDTDVEMDLLMDGSIKYHKMTEELQQEEGSLEGLTSITNSTSEISKKSKAAVKSKLHATISSCHVSDGSEQIEEKPFNGFDISDRRVEAFGKDATYVCKNCTSISSFYTLMIPYNFEHIVLRVLVGDGDNEFWIHKAMGENISPEILDRCDSFRVNTKNNLMMNINEHLIPSPNIFNEPETRSKVNVQNKSGVFEKNISDTEPSTIDTRFQFSNQRFYSFTITWPIGLITESVHDVNSNTISHIKQYYSIPQDQLDEEMRCISLNGEVIKFNKSGSIEVLRPNGETIKITKYEKRLIAPDTPDLKSNSSPSSNLKSKKKKDNIPKIPSEYTKPPEYELFIDEFELLNPDGVREKWVNDVPTYYREALRTVTDYYSGEINITRNDSTHKYICNDHVVTFPDKTRISTECKIEDELVYPEWTQEEKDFLNELNDFERDIKDSQSQPNSYPSSVTTSIDNEFTENFDEGYVFISLIFTVEHANYTTVIINQFNGAITVESPNDTSLTVDIQNQYTFSLNEKTSAKFDGHYLKIEFEPCRKSNLNTTCEIEINEKLGENSQVWATLRDACCKDVFVDYAGNINVTEGSKTVSEDDNEKQTNVTSDNIIDANQEYCLNNCAAKGVRFIIMHRDLTCSELLHRSTVKQYKKECNLHRWCRMESHKVFGDHRSLLTILTPLHKTETEKWIMPQKDKESESDIAAQKRAQCSKGWYHWMRPYGRFEPNKKIANEKQPCAFVLRTLEQQWDAKERNTLKGAKELVSAILKYRQVIEADDTESLLHLPIVDVDMDQPKRNRVTRRIVKALAKKLISDLNIQLMEFREEWASLTITTRPPVVQEEVPVVGEQEEDSWKMEEETSEKAEETQTKTQSPNLQRYWRRRARELEETEFFLYLLRAGYVPKYFLNLLGGAIWWQLNNLTDEAIQIAQHKKMKCLCPPKETKKECCCLAANDSNVKCLCPPKSS